MLFSRAPMGTGAFLFLLLFFGFRVIFRVILWHILSIKRGIFLPNMVYFVLFEIAVKPLKYKGKTAIC